MGKHTQGPWSIKRHANAVWIEAAKRQQVCDITTETPKGDELEDASDNAQLIAAAPDLLAACESMLLTLDSFAESLGFKRSGHHCAEAAREAIAKARYGIQ